MTLPHESWAFIAVAFGALMLALALAWRIGLVPVGLSRKAKWYHQWYRNPEASRLVRGASGAAIPMGAAFLAAGAAFALNDLQVSRTAVMALFVAAIVFLVLGALVLFRTPALLKPAWVRREDRLRAEGAIGEVEVPEDGTTPTVARWELGIVLAAAALIIAGVALWRWPPSLLIGVGVAASILSFHRLRR